MTDLDAVGHCDGPASATGVAVTTASSHVHDDDDYSATGSVSLAPSPTESAGCEPHGDHW